MADGENQDGSRGHPAGDQARAARRLRHEEIEVRMRSIAVPVLTAKGATVAAMSLSSRSSEMSLKQMVDEALPVLQAASRSLTEQL